MTYSILILQAYLGQQEQQRGNLIKRKNGLNPEGKRTIEAPLEEVQKNIQDLTISIEHLENLQIVGKKS